MVIQNFSKNSGDFFSLSLRCKWVLDRISAKTTSRRSILSSISKIRLPEISATSSLGIVELACTLSDAKAEETGGGGGGGGEGGGGGVGAGGGGRGREGVRTADELKVTVDSGCGRLLGAVGGERKNSNLG